jgi:acyl dehydratase
VNTGIVGRKYRTPALFIRPDRIREYASATNDPNSIYTKKTNDKDLIASPIFPVTIVSDLFKEMLSDDTGIDLSRMVHGEQSITFYSVLRPWDLISPRGVISKVERRGNNDVVYFDQILYRDGEVVAKIVSSLVVRGSGPKSETGASTKLQSVPTGKPVFTHVMTVSSDQPRRYADASGDHNPIHIDNDIAKAAGFPGVILHGLCTMAFAGQAVVEKALGGDIRRLKELSVRFSKPVFPGNTLTFTAFQNEKGQLSIQATNEQGVPVITNGVARFEGANA